MNIKTGDKVIVLSGDDKGKTGIVQRVYPKLNKVVVEGVNVHKKHKKPTQNTPEGSILDIYVPLDIRRPRKPRGSITRSSTGRKSASALPASPLKARSEEANHG